MHEGNFYSVIGGLELKLKFNSCFLIDCLHEER